MPRRIFSAGTVTNTTGAPLRLTFYANSTTARRETDLWTVDGSNNPSAQIPNGVILTDASGAYSAFAGPDDVDTLCLNAHTGSARTAIAASGYVASSGLPNTYGKRLVRSSLPAIWPTTGQALAPAADIPTAATSGPGGAPPITGGFTNRNLPYNSAAVTGLGSVDATIVGTGSVNYLQNQVSGLSGSGATPCGRSFDYYGLDLAIQFRNNVSGNTRFWVWVDGQPTTAAPVASTAAAANSAFYYRLTWGTARLRRVTVYTENADWGGVYCAFTDTVTPAPKPGLSLLVIGDSYVAGTGATYALQGWAFTLGRMLGAEVYCAGQAGTGYTNGITFGDATRLAKITGLAPTITVVAGSINDSGASASTVQTAATTALTAIQAANPTTRLAVMSVQQNTGTMSAANIANDASVAAAATAVGASVIARPISEGWIDGTGRVGTTTGNGNADVFVTTDGIHPSPAGHDYYARKMFNAIAATLPVT